MDGEMLREKECERKGKCEENSGGIWTIRWQLCGKGIENRMFGLVKI